MWGGEGGRAAVTLNDPVSARTDALKPLRWSDFHSARRLVAVRTLVPFVTFSSVSFSNSSQKKADHFGFISSGKTDP